MRIRSNPVRSFPCWIAAAGIAISLGHAPVLGVSPESVQMGRQLFERNWSPGNPAFGSDGLGPLFNGRSCVACHNQQGVGGGGEAPFNAKTVGIEEMKIDRINSTGFVSDDVIARMVRSFHPGFVLPNGTVTNTLPLSHQGGSTAFLQANRRLISQVPAEFDDFGGPQNAEETRMALTPILFHNKIGDYEITLRARLFHRNTTALYGSGLIDQVSDKEIDTQVRAQKSHSEISGRPSTLDDGRYGKFGWRANVATLLEFNEQACANEVGLETRRKKQPFDPMVPGYKNPAVDISDNQIRTLTSFVASLPAPIQAISSDRESRANVARGEQAFASVGCAVCHVPTMGPAVGVFSDLLLHDMGYDSMDLNSAEPYRVAVTPIVLEATMTTTSTRMSSTYYGRTSTISTTMTTRSGSTDVRPARRSRGPSRRFSNFNFGAPTRPVTPVIHELGSRSTNKIGPVESESKEYKQLFGSGTASMSKITQRQRRTDQKLVLRVDYEPTNFNQEWRTPPLWGVRDSAPYMHDGRAETLLEAISLHGGESAGTRDRFLQLSYVDRQSLIAFLETLVAPPGVPQPPK